MREWAANYSGISFWPVPNSEEAMLDTYFKNLNAYNGSVLSKLGSELSIKYNRMPEVSKSCDIMPSPVIAPCPAVITIFSTALFYQASSCVGLILVCDPACLYRDSIGAITTSDRQGVYSTAMAAIGGSSIADVVGAIRKGLSRATQPKEVPSPVSLEAIQRCKRIGLQGFWLIKRRLALIMGPRS
jgi:hypothetical protein